MTFKHEVAVSTCECLTTVVGRRRRRQLAVMTVLTLLASVALTFLAGLAFPETNYYVRTSWVILSTFAVVAVPTWLRNGWQLPPGRLLQAASPGVARFGWALLGSLLVCHVMFH